MDGKEKLPQAVETGSSPQETGERQAKERKAAPRLAAATGMSGRCKPQARRYLVHLG